MALDLGGCLEVATDALVSSLGHFLSLAELRLDALALGDVSQGCDGVGPLAAALHGQGNIDRHVPAVFAAQRQITAGTDRPRRRPREEALPVPHVRARGGTGHEYLPRPAE